VSAQSYRCPLCTYLGPNPRCMNRHAIGHHDAEWRGPGLPLRPISPDRLQDAREHLRLLQRNSQRRRREKERGRRSRGSGPRGPPSVQASMPRAVVHPRRAGEDDDPCPAFRRCCAVSVAAGEVQDRDLASAAAVNPVATRSWPPRRKNLHSLLWGNQSNKNPALARAQSRAMSYQSCPTAPCGTWTSTPSPGSPTHRRKNQPRLQKNRRSHRDQRSRRCCRGQKNRRSYRGRGSREASRLTSWPVLSWRPR